MFLRDEGGLIKSCLALAFLEDGDQMFGRRKLMDNLQNWAILKVLLAMLKAWVMFRSKLDSW